MPTKLFKRMYALCWRLFRGVNKAIIHIILPRISKYDLNNLVRLGSGYGGWTIPKDYLDENSICYCVGVGLDATFDFELVKNYNCDVYSFDPTPKAIKYMETEEYDRQKVHFQPVGVWDENTQLKFYSPANPDQTSHSVYDLHGTDNYFTADCRKISTIMNELGHDHIDLLKLDIEGAWRRVVKNIFSDNITVSILCLEMDSPVTLRKVFSMIRFLKQNSMRFIHVEKDNYLFIHENVLSKID